MHLILIYAGVFLGIFLEGEMVMISSVIVAHHGHLNLWIVVIIGITGTYASDSTYFFLGRKRGRVWLDKKKKWDKKREIIDNYLLKYPIIIFILYRFLYGFRAITPLVIGASRTKTSKFLILAGVSTLIWAAAYCSIGYLFGEVIKSKLQHIENIEKYVIGVLLFFGIILVMTNVLKRRKKIVKVGNA